MGDQHTFTVDVHEPKGKDESAPKRLSMDGVKLTIGKDSEEKSGSAPYVFTLNGPGKGVLQFKKKGYFPYQFRLQVNEKFAVTFDKQDGVDGPRMASPLQIKLPDGSVVQNSYNFEIAPTLEFVLVAGHDFHGGVIFRKAAFTRMCDRYGIGKSTLHPSTVFTVFDFSKGHCAQWVRAWGEPEGAHEAWPFWSSGWCNMSDEVCGKKEPEFKAELRDKKTDWFLSPDDTDSISILHVYNYLQAAGKERSGTIKELSFFSHSFEFGPSLMNTFDDRENMGKMRDPKDRDARAFKDFPTALETVLKDDNQANPAETWAIEVMDKAAKLAKAHKDDDDHFRAAFAPNAHLHVWGCTAHSRFRALLHHAAKPGTHDLGKWTYPKDELASSKFHPPLVPNGNEEDPDSREVVAGFFPPFGNSFPNNGNGAERAYLEWACRYNYMYMLSCATGLPVWGAPPGLGADENESGPWAWMAVPQQAVEKKTRISGSGKMNLVIDHTKEGYSYAHELNLLKDKTKFSRGFEFDEDGYMKYMYP